VTTFLFSIIVAVLGRALVAQRRHVTILRDVIDYQRQALEARWFAVLQAARQPSKRHIPRSTR